MNGSVLRIGTKIIFRFSYSPQLNQALKAASEHRVRWNPDLCGFTLPVSDLQHHPDLRAAVRGFITENGFEADAAVLLLLWPALRVSWDAPPKPSAAPGNDRQERRLDRWESALRRMHGVLDALDMLLRRVWKMPVVHFVVVLTVSVILAWYE